MIDRIIDFSVRNKFLVLLLVAAAALAGVHALQNVPLDAIPDLGDTQVIVYSRWERSPDLVEAQVTYPIVTALLGAPGVRAVRGVSVVVRVGASNGGALTTDGGDVFGSSGTITATMTAAATAPRPQLHFNGTTANQPARRVSSA